MHVHVRGEQKALDLECEGGNLINVWPQGNDIGLSIEDLDSTNGVTVNGVKVTSTELGDGSRIEIGSTRMLVHSPTRI